MLHLQRHVHAGILKKFCVCVALEYKCWQKAILEYCQTVPLNEAGTGPRDPKTWVTGLRNAEFYQNFSKDEMKKAIPFASFMMKDEMAIRGKEALETELPFNEQEMLAEKVGLIQKQLGVGEIVFRFVADGKIEGDNSDKINNAQPAKPAICFLDREVKLKVNDDEAG
eukprot:g8089.t1